MKEERLMLLREILVTQMNHWPLFTLAVTVIGLWRGPRPVMWLWWLCSLVPFVFYLIRCRVEGFFFTLVFHVACIAAVWVIPLEDTRQMAVARIMLVVYMLLSFRIRLRGGEQEDKGIFPPVGVGIVAVAMYVTHNQGQKTWDSYYVLSLVAFLGINFLIFYLDRFLRFLVVNSSAGHIPAREMLRSGMRQAGLYTAVGVVILLSVSGMGWLSGVEAQLRAWLIALLKLLFAGKGEKEPEPIVEEPLPMSKLPPALEEGETAAFWVILQKILMLVLSIIFLVAVVVGVVLFVRFLILRLRERPVAEARKPDEVVDEREKIVTDRQRRKRKNPFSFLDPRERIRRIFQKRVWAGREKILGGKQSSHRLEVLTARECSQRLEQDLLGKIYDKARYSEEECTMDDVRALRDEG